MKPSELTPTSFAAYPASGRGFAQKHILLLQQMPLSLLPGFLEEIRSYDWRFPPEQAQLQHRMEWLESLSPGARQQALAPFAAITLNDQLEGLHWVEDPPTFMAALSAYLWQSGQIDRYRAAAVQLWEAMPTKPEAEAVPPAVFAVMGEGATDTEYELFRKLKPLGMYATRVSPEGGAAAFTGALQDRAKKIPGAYRHWYFDGGASPWPTEKADGLVGVSYSALAPMNRAVLAAMDQAIVQGTGPEVLQTRLSHAEPGPFGADGITPDGRLQRFYLSLLTGGSGTQIFSTSFVQWAAHETLRRAQPATMLLRFAPRRRQAAMNTMVQSSSGEAELDPNGSLIDADMAAYYTWLEMARQPAGANGVLVAWAAERREAVILGPSVTRGVTMSSPTTVRGLLQMALA